MKLLIVDDHAMVREGLAALLGHIEADAVVLQAGDGTEGLEIVAREADLDAVFLDLSMPGGGVAAIRAFSRQRPELPVVVLSSSEDPQDVRHALAAGARGYLPKSAGAQTMLSALRLVLAGEIYVPPLMVDATVGESPASFTDRQIEVLRHLCRGASNKEIARNLAISEKTAKAHVTAIFRGLKVVNRMQAATAARRAGLIADT
jgi:two-component system, NarL family, nitrate/nitrite response regulator NarL